MEKPFRLPKQIRVTQDRRLSVSCRMKESIKKKLEKAASRTPDKLTLAVFIEQVLKDYVDFLEKKEEL